MSPEEYRKARPSLVDAIVTEAFAWHGYHVEDRDGMGERDRALHDAIGALYDLNQQLLDGTETAS